MPNFDGGHLFLTVLAPVRTDAMVDPIVRRSRSHRHMLAQKLALIHTGRQTAASAPEGEASPFSRNTLNHFARMAIIDGPAFNGRLSQDTLVGLLRKTDPLVAQPVDQLTNPFLLFAADIDAPAGPSADPSGGAGDALRAYTDALWATMQADLAAIFIHCVGFEGVQDAAGFNAYIRRCQVDTTMPFNDYWADGLPLPADGGHGLGAVVKLAIYGVALLAAAWVAAVLLSIAFGVAGATSPLSIAIGRVAARGALAWLVAIGAALIGVYFAYRWVLARGAKPLPTAPGSDLPSVLKSLFLQQQFTRFAIEAQGLDERTLHARFGAFLTATQPAHPSPAQGAGETRSTPVDWSSAAPSAAGAQVPS